MVDFVSWYQSAVADRTYAEQARYERESVAFRAVDDLSEADIKDLIASLDGVKLRMMVYDHVCRCLEEAWDPKSSDGWNDDSDA